MREANFTFNDFFSSINRRSSIVEDENFVYGHYQIGNKYKLGISNFREKNNKCGYATIGGVRSGNKFYYSVALCSPADNFSKNIGRKLVCSHMYNDCYSHKRGVVILDDKLINEHPAVVLRHVLEVHLEKTHHLPSWTKQNVFFRKPPKKRKNIQLESGCNLK